jgi:hypothetical protein
MTMADQPATGRLRFDCVDYVGEILARSLMKHDWAFVPPKGFVDRTPGRGFWSDPDCPPEPDSWAYQVMLEDGRTTASAYTGTGWWGDGGRLLAPIAWRPIQERTISA